MRRLWTPATLAALSLLVLIGSSFGQAYPRHPYEYKPGNAGVMGIGPGGREAYHPDYYTPAPGTIYGYGPGYYYPPNITGMPSEPMALPDSVQPGRSVSRYGPSPAATNAAAIDVKVPAGARLWFQGRETRQRGTERFFESPPLAEGKHYAYQVKVQWTDENGKVIERKRNIEVRPGAHITVDLRNVEPTESKGRGAS
jgi:uncharacterized protein (TIGR03000 family)